MPRLLTFQYPLRSGQPHPALPVLQRVFPIFRTLRDNYRTMKTTGVELTPRQSSGPLRKDDLPLVAVLHNERRLLPAFLAHYRRLGVTRFIFVDDASTDGTGEFLAAQPDVDLYTSNVGYKQAYRGRLWREILVKRYGIDRWYLMVDADEFLVTGWTGDDLRDFVAAMERRRIWHMPAVMLDMYPHGRIASGQYDGTEMPWDVAPLYDGSGYQLFADHRSWKIFGGVRQRFFGEEFQLNKYPLIRWDSRTNLNRSIHSPAPYWRNYSPLLGALLHFKFFADFDARFRYLVSRAQHYDGAVFYSEILDRIPDSARLELQSDVSVAYAGASDLVRRGFFVELNAPK